MPVFLQHLPNRESLKTSQEEIRSAFVAQALEKGRIASPCVEAARQLKSAAMATRTPRDLLNVPSIQKALLTAAGVSIKGTKNIPVEAKTDAIDGLIRKYLEPAGNAFVEEMVFRYLLIRGGMISGSLNNIVGNWARQRISKKVIASLRNADLTFYWCDRKRKNKWYEAPESDLGDVDIVPRVKGISWIKNGQNRTLSFDIKIPIVGKNVDINLLACSFSDLSHAKKNPHQFIALGELKGGIDPAGADERWKTTRSALTDIRSEFAREEASPAIFFIAASITERMSIQIWDRLQNETLANAANLTNDEQTSAICNWLANL